MQDGPGADAAEAAELAAGGKHGKAQQQASLAEKKGRGKKGKVDAADTSKRAELEMLLMDDAALLAAARGGNAASASAPAGKQQAGAAPAPKLSKKERMRLKKEAKRRERLEGSDDEDAAAGALRTTSSQPHSPRKSATSCSCRHCKGCPCCLTFSRLAGSDLAPCFPPCAVPAAAAALLQEAAPSEVQTCLTLASRACSPPTTLPWTQPTRASSEASAGGFYDLHSTLDIVWLGHLVAGARCVCLRLTRVCKCMCLISFWS